MFFFLVETAGSVPNHKCPSIIYTTKPQERALFETGSMLNLELFSKTKKTRATYKNKNV